MEVKRLSSLIAINAVLIVSNFLYGQNVTIVTDGEDVTFDELLVGDFYYSYLDSNTSHSFTCYTESVRKKGFLLLEDKDAIYNMVIKSDTAAIEVIDEKSSKMVSMKFFVRGVIYANDIKYKDSYDTHYYIEYMNGKPIIISEYTKKGTLIKQQEFE